MKNLSAISLLTIYLFFATDLKEMLKINVVVKHYQETKQLDNSVSPFQFLVMHYITDDHNDTDNERDKQLPFKSPDSCISDISFASIACQISSLSFRSFEFITNDFSADNDSFVFTYFNDLVWHPPQFS